MVSRTDPGLIPRLCNELFARISQPDAEKKINYSGPDKNYFVSVEVNSDTNLGKTIIKLETKINLKTSLLTW